MAAWCLPRNLQNDFLAAIRDGRLTPDRLAGMTSEERRAAFSEILGPENAREVNAQFESKLLLKDQQRGFVSWAKKVGGLTEPARRDLLSTINKLDRVLNPDEEKAFLEDLASKKLGVSVTADEAKQVFDLAQKAEQLRAGIEQRGGGDYRAGFFADEKAGTDYGVAYQALQDKINSLKPGGQTFQNAALNILSVPRSALTSVFHWSAPFVQGWGMISTKEWAFGIGKMFQYFASPEAYDRLNGWILSHPNYALIKEGKLGLTDISDALTHREEDIQSSLLQDASTWFSEKSGISDLIGGAPGPVKWVLGGDGNLIKAWSRSFTGFLNYVRFSRASNLIEAARLVGADVSQGSQVVRNICRTVNNFTGRGDEISLGFANPKLNPEVATALNAVFFSPRKIAATIEMWNPISYARLDPFTRKAAARQMLGSLAATGAVLALAKVSGAQVNFDPRAGDFGKVRLGNETLDMTGGNASYVRLLSRLVTNQMVTRTGKVDTLGQGGPTGPTRTSLVTDFLRSRLSPVASALWTAGVGHDPVGRPFTLTNAAADELSPIVIHSLIDVWMNDPHDAVHLLPALSGFLGVAVESPDPPVSQTGRSVWGEPIAPFASHEPYFNDPVTQEAQRVGLNLSFPPDTIRGVKLNDQQYDDYVRLSGRLAHMRLEELIGEGGFQAEPQAQQLKEMTGARISARGVEKSELGLDTIGAPAQ